MRTEAAPGNPLGFRNRHNSTTSIIVSHSCIAAAFYCLFIHLKMDRPVHHFPYNSIVHLNDAVIEGRGGLTIHGDRNTITAGYSTVYGSGNMISGSSPTVIGDSNTINRSYARVTGSHNVVNGSGVIVRGNSNRVTDNYTTVYGDSNVVHGDWTKVEGGGNRVTGSYASVLGNHNIVDGKNTSVSGSNNTVTGEYASANGGRSNNIVNGLPAEQERERQRQQQHLHQRLSSMQQSLLERGQIQDPRHPLSTLQASIFQHQVPVQVPHHQQPQQPLPATLHVTQPIKLTLRGHDEEAANENVDTCLCCLSNKAVVASICCGKLTACLACTREMYGGKNVGAEKCLSCQGFVEHMLRIS
jgi:hypothetical protein